MKKILVPLFLVLVILLSPLSLVGCGDKNTNSKSSGGSEGKQPEQTDLSFYDSIPEKLKGTTIRFATWKDHTKEEAAPVLADFQALTGINIKLEYIPQNEYASKLTAMVSANQSPDMLVINGNWLDLAGLLTPLEDAGVDTSDKFWNQDIQNVFKINGKTYATNAAKSAWGNHGQCVIWNKTIFNDYGIKTPQDYIDEDNWTLETFRKMLKQVSAADPDLTGGLITYNTFVQCYAKNNIVSYDPSNQTVKLDSSNDIKEAIKWCVNAQEEGIARVVYNGLGNGMNFAEGKAGIAFDSVYSIRSNGYLASMNHDDLEYALPPKADANSEYPIYGSYRAYGICKGSKNAEATGYFIRYFTDANSYDMSEVYPNDRALEFANNAASKAVYKPYDISQEVWKMVYTESQFKSFVDLTSASQVDTTFDSMISNYNPCVQKANQHLSNVVKGLK